MSNFKQSLALLVLTVLPVIAFAQTCMPDQIRATTPTNQFKDNGNGTVSDTETGLMWKKCSEGQTGSDCSKGSAQAYTLFDAVEHAKSVNSSGGFAAFKDWRIPTSHELVSIQEQQCVNPGINLTVFPNTPFGVKIDVATSSFNLFWSSSSDQDGGAWGIDFNNGNLIGENPYFHHNIRLVRENQVINKAVVPEKKAVSENEIATATEKDIPFKMEFSCTKELENKSISLRLITHDHYDVDYKNGNLFILAKTFSKKVGELEYKQSQGIFDNPNYEIEAKSITKIQINKEKSGFQGGSLFLPDGCYYINIYGAFKDNPESSSDIRMVFSNNIDDLNKLKNKLLSINKNIQVNGQ